MELKVQSSEKWANPWWSFYHETTATFSQYDLKWVSNDTFEITVRVPVRNWGGTDRWFDCYLYVDDLPGKPLGKFGLAPGGSQNVEQAVQIKGLTGVKRNDHQLVFIADQSEESNQGYPNSYMNNFVRIYLKIIPGGTVTGK
jgi:hypothetical protein